MLNNGMMKVFRHIATYDNTKGSLYSWAYTIVRNAALDQMKKKKYPSALQMGEDLLLTSDNTPVLQLESKEFYTLLDHLQEPGRAICSLFYVEGFSVSEIARHLQMAEGTVKWHLHLVRKSLKPVLEKYYG